MKIAAITENGTNISQHFGQARHYMVLTVEDGKVVNREMRDKAGHHSFGGHHENSAHGERHGYDAAAQSRHASMIDSITDCQVLLAGGMGWGAYDSLKSHNIEAIITDKNNIDEAVQLYLGGKLTNLMERLH